MKKYALLCFVLLAILHLSSCNRKNLPDTVQIENLDYKRAFTATLFPIDDIDNDGIKKPLGTLGPSFYRYQSTRFDCYIAYDLYAQPNLYFASEQYDEAVSYYQSGDNFDYFFSSHL